jgi:hypothetical protein
VPPLVKETVFLAIDTLILSYALENAELVS